jgi:hypothetical protein
MKTIEFNEKTDVPENEVINFMNQYVRVNNYSHNDFTWQYKTFKDLSAFFFMYDKEVIASQGMIYHNLVSNTNHINTVKSESSFLSKDYRGMGLFEKIYFDAIEYCIEKNIDFVWGFTALGKIWEKKLGFECFNVFYECQITLSPLKIFNKSKHIFIKRVIQFMKNSLNYSVTSSKIRKPNFELKLIENIGELNILNKIKRKWDISNSNLVSLHLDDNYLKWRIFDNPKCSYDCFIILDGKGDEIGFAICNVSNTHIYLVEVIVLEEKNITESLKAILKRYYDCKDTISFSYLGNIKNTYNYKIFKALQKLGGNIKEIKDMIFVLKNISKKEIKLDISKFTLNGLWTEGFKI